jgi:hypothetical protein
VAQVGGTYVSATTQRDIAAANCAAVHGMLTAQIDARVMDPHIDAAAVDARLAAIVLPAARLRATHVAVTLPSVTLEPVWSATV